MNLSRSTRWIAARCTLCALVVSAAAFAQDQEPQAVVNANSVFAVDLFRALGKGDSRKNVFVSPFSVSTALAMTYEGSRGGTRRQMAAVLHLTMPDAARRQEFAALLARTQAGPGKHYKLETANALWGQKDYHFEAAFTGTIKEDYGGGFFTVDYMHDKRGSIHTINRWIENKTAGKIVNLLHADDVSQLTRLILTNAIYFKGNWAVQFEKDATRQEAFHLAGDAQVPTPMMHQSGNYLYVKQGGLAAIELPYADHELSMLAILPDGDIGQLDQSLTVEEIHQLQAHMREQDVEVVLPRFKFETRYALKPVLSAMGMRDAFDEGLADFSGMTGHPDLFIDQVIHQARIEVNEEGSEAAASTAVVMNLKAMREERRLVFRADRPFLFFIVHNATGSILFMGRLCNPAS